VQSVKVLYLRNAVAAFLSHDFRNSACFYSLYLLAVAAHSARSLHLFLQSRLIRISVGDGVLAAARSAWNTPMAGVPDDLSEAERQAPQDLLAEELTRLYGDGEPWLLRQLQADDSVTCRCLDAEDPDHPDFSSASGARGAGDGAGDGAEAPQGTQSAYELCCRLCRKPPARSQLWPKSVRCERARYCTKECQRADWRKHKAVCGKRQAARWGKSPVATRQQRRQQGLVSATGCAGSLLQGPPMLASIVRFDKDGNIVEYIE
jgi:MYND finger